MCARVRASVRPPVRARTRVCVCVCVCVYVRVCVCVCEWVGGTCAWRGGVRASVCVCVCIGGCVCVRMCMSVRACVRVHARVRACVRARVFLNEKKRRERSYLAFFENRSGQLPRSPKPSTHRPCLRRLQRHQRHID